MGKKKNIRSDDNYFNLFQWTPCQARYSAAGSSDSEISQCRLLSRVRVLQLFIKMSITQFQPSDLLVETTPSSGEEADSILVIIALLVSKLVYYLLFIVTLYV